MPYVLNPAHAAFAVVAHAWPFKEGTGLPVDIVSSDAVTLAGAAAWTEEASGWGITLGYSDYITLGLDTALLPTAPDMTVVFRGRLLTAPSTGDGGYRFGQEGGDVANSWDCAMPLDDSKIYFGFGVQFGGTGFLVSNALSWNTSLDTFVIRVQSGQVQIWRNGTSIKTVTASMPTRTNGGYGVNIGRVGVSAFSKQFVDLMVFLDGTPNDTVCADMSSNPWDLFVLEGVHLGGEASVDVSATLRAPAQLGGSASVDVAASAFFGTPLDGAAEIGVSAIGDLIMPKASNTFRNSVVVYRALQARFPNLVVVTEDRRAFTFRNSVVTRHPIPSFRNRVTVLGSDIVDAFNQDIQRPFGAATVDVP